MQRRRSLSLVLVGALTLAGCATVTRVADPAALAPLDPVAAVFAREGSVSYTIERATRNGVYGRDVEYEVYTPDPSESDVLVVLGHGFLRSLAAMRGWAALWASHGARVVVMSYVNSSPFDGNHDRNAEDMVALARSLHGGPVIYAGFSAGGLAAFLAAAADDSAVGWLGLDAVDSGGMAVAARDRVGVPAFDLLGESSACNAKNNFLPALPEGARVLRVTNATHGHFENPYDPAVERVCGRVEPAEVSEEILVTIRALATVWILDRAGRSSVASAVLGDAMEGRGVWAGRVGRP